MAKKKTQTRQRRARRPLRGNCPFCKTGTLPSYKRPEELQNYISDRAKILPRFRSGVCAKHQRSLTREIKRARHLALLPFVIGIK